MEIEFIRKVGVRIRRRPRKKKLGTREPLKIRKSRPSASDRQQQQNLICIRQICKFRPRQREKEFAELIGIFYTSYEVSPREMEKARGLRGRDDPGGNAGDFTPRQGMKFPESSAFSDPKKTPGNFPVFCLFHSWKCSRYWIFREEKIFSLYP